MTNRWTSFEIATGAGAGLLCITFACLSLKAGAIQNEVAARAAGSLVHAGLHWGAVEPHGRQVIVSGAAPDSATAAAAGEMVAAVPGVASVDNRIAVIGTAGRCQGRLDATLQGHGVRFRKGQAELAPASEPLLLELAKVIEGCGVRIEVAVHAHPESSARLAQALTQRRAEMVARRLVAHGLDVEHVVATGYGVAQPVAVQDAVVSGAGPTSESERNPARQPAQRVEFRILGAVT